jgi:hypothetical protein
MGELLEELLPFRIRHVSAKNTPLQVNCMALADFLSRPTLAEGEVDSERELIRMGYKDLRDKRLEKLKYPDYLPEKTTLHELYENVVPYLEEFDRKVLNNTDVRGRPLPQFNATPTTQEAAIAAKVVSLDSSSESDAEMDTAIFPVLPRALNECLNAIGAYRQEIADKLQYVRFCPYVRVREFEPDQPVIDELRLDPSSGARVLLVTLQQAFWSADTVREHQLNDRDLGPTLRYLDDRSNDPRKRPNYSVKKGVLLRWRKNKATQVFEPLVALPRTLVQPLLSMTHGRYGGMHTGYRKLVLYLQTMYYWPNMKVDCLDFISKCPTCQYNSPYAPRLVDTTTPMRAWKRNQIVFVDVITGLPRSRDGNTNIICFVDGFTKFAVTVATPNKEARTVANAYRTRWIPYFTPAKQLNSDRGETNAEIVQNLCKLVGTVKSASSVYYPQGDGAVEALNRVIMNLLRHELAGADESFWDQYLPYVTMLYNAAPHSKTGRSPFLMMFGEEMGNVVPCVDLSHPMMTDEYLRATRKAQEIHWAVVREMQRAELDKRQAAASVGHSFEVGDFILVKKRSGNPRGMNKLGEKTHRWRGPYRVLRRFPGSLLVTPYQLGSSLVDTEGLNPDLDVEGEFSRLSQDVVPVKDCKPYHGAIPPVPEINSKRARELLRLLGVNTSLMDGPEGNADVPAVRDLGPENVPDGMLDADLDRYDADTEDEAVRPFSQATRGRPRKVSRSEQTSPGQQDKSSAQNVPENNQRRLGRTRSATRTLAKHAAAAAPQCA